MKGLLQHKRMAMAIAALAIAVFSVAAAYAQIEGEIEAKIPFAFSLENTRLPAGDYYFRPSELGSPTLEVENYDGKIGVFIMPQAAAAPSRPKISELVFDKIGTQYFLREIWVEGNSDGYKLEKSKAELKLEKSGTKTEQHRLTVKHSKTRIKK